MTIATKKLLVKQQKLDHLEAMKCGVMCFPLWNSGSSKDEKTEKTRQVVSLMTQKLAKATGLVEVLSQQIEELNEERNAAKKEYNQLLLEKKAVLMGKTSPKWVRSKLRRDSSQENRVAYDIQNLERFISLGERALSSLRATQSHLSDASDWGTFDLLGGGIVVSMMKNERIHDAKRSGAVAQGHLRDFVAHGGKNGLADSLAGNLEEMGAGFTAFADVWLDNIFTDWAVQSQISRSYKSCSVAMSKVRALIEAGKDHLTLRQQELSERKREEEEFIVHY